MLTRSYPVRIALTLSKQRRRLVLRSSKAYAVLSIACAGLVGPLAPRVRRHGKLTPSDSEN